MSFILNAYQGLMRILDPWAIQILKHTSHSLDVTRLDERRGLCDQKRPDGAIIWIHGVSVGEALCALALGQVFQSKRSVTILITTHTITAAQMIDKRCREQGLSGIINQYAPLDTPQAIERFLNHWKPAVHIGIEQDIWPNWIRALKSHSIPCHLVSARLTENSAKKWQKLPKTIKTILSYYDTIWPQDARSQTHFQNLGTKTKPILNLKSIGSVLSIDHGLKQELKQSIGNRTIWLAASTHPQEEALITLSLEQAIEKKHLLIICPRHIDRAEEIVTILADLGHKVLRRSKGEKPDANTKIYLADSLGEMGLWFDLSDHTIIGGSFFSHIGGHNPLEAARLKKGVISGPHFENWAGIYEQLQADNACMIAQDRESLNLIISNLMISSGAQKLWNLNAYNSAIKLENATQSALDALSSVILDQVSNLKDLNGSTLC